MAKHRGHNEGSVTQRESGKWRARVFVAGRRISQDGFSTKDDANKWVRRQLTDADNGLLPAEGGKVKVDEFLALWLKTVEASLKPKSYKEYSIVVRLHLAPTLGKLKLIQLRADHVQALYAEKLNAGYSTKSVQNYHLVLHRALEHAVKWNLVARNVCDAATCPKVVRKEMKTWTPEQARQFLVGINDDRLAPFYHLALSTGLRLGELLGLRWEDVDLQAGRLQVRRTLQRLGKGTGITVGEPKTAKGRRQIVLSLAVVEALRKWRVRQISERLLAGSKWKESGHLFTSRVGTPFEAGTVRAHFYRTLERLGLPRIRPHDLRHTCASLLLSQGVHPKVVQEMLGHSQIAITLDTYSHVLPTMQEEAARVLERVLSGT